MTPRSEFTARFAHLFEHSPWVVERTFDSGAISPGDDEPEKLHRAFCATLAAARQEERLALVRAHPDLAGKLAAAGELTAESTREQASAGLDRLTAEERATFTALNEAYKNRFGFPFVMAIKGRHKDEILAAFRRRLQNDPEEELAEAVRQVENIVRLRLEEMCR